MSNLQLLLAIFFQSSRRNLALLGTTDRGFASAAEESDNESMKDATPFTNPFESNQRTQDAQVHEMMNRKLREFIVGDEPGTAHPCVGAQAAFRKQEYQFGVYAELGSSASARHLAHDLFEFIQDQTANPKQFATLLAVFQTPIEMTEVDFEKRLWKQLEELDLLSREHFEWDRAVSADPENPKFSFSFGGQAFYIVGLHANSSRTARSFEYPMLAFNLHSQFEALRASGQYERMKDVIRKRDKALQGSNNEMLKDFGQASEARQYSGRQIHGEWKCPFHRN